MEDAFSIIANAVRPVRRTTQDYTVNYRQYGQITVPKGTRVSNIAADGSTISDFFVDEFDWIEPYEDGTPNYSLIRTADVFGIVIPKEFVN